MFKWIRTHKNIVLIIGSACVLITVLIFSFLGNGSSAFGMRLQSIIFEIQKPITQFGQSIERGASGVFDFRATVEENQELRERIAELEEQVLESKLSAMELDELKRLSLALNFESVRESEIKVVSKIVSIDGTNHFNIFTIDAGILDGVRKDAVVVNGQGIIGRVYEAGGSFAKVISIIDTNANVSFRIFRSETESYLGIAYGNGNGGLSGYMLDASANVMAGDQLITSGMGIYPEGLVIGTVTEVLPEEDLLLKYIEIETAVNFNNLSKVLVLVTKESL